MKIRATHLLVLPLLASCGGDGSTGPEIASVTVSAVKTAISVGEATQFAAVATGPGGATVTGQTVMWSTDDSTVARVDQSGVATGVSPGVVSVLAVIGGVPGSKALTVSPNTCQNGVEVALGVGEHAVYGPEECLVLPAGSVGDRYRVSLVRTQESGSASNVATGVLKATALGVVAEAPPPAPPRVASPSLAERLGIDVSRIRRRMEVTARAHAAIRAMEDELDRRLGPPRLDPRPVLTGAPLRAASPDTMRFNVGLSCSSADSSTAVLVHENDDVAIYQDTTERSTQPVSVLAADSIAEYYSTYGKQVVASYFGTPSDLDGNGKLVVLAAPVVVGDTSAYVTSRDMRARSECAASNQMELVYFNTDLLDSPEDESDMFFALETIVHEAEHVSALYHRLHGPGGNHPTWIEEGRAELAAEMASRNAWAAGGGPAVGTRVDRDDLLADGAVTDRSFGTALMVIRAMWYTGSQPNGLVVKPDGADDIATVYSSGWHFNRWLGDAYGMAGSGAFADSSFFRSLTDSTSAEGTAGLQAKLGKTYVELLEEFVVAISTHRQMAVEPEHVFSTYDFVSLTDGFWLEQPDPADGTYPYPVTGANPVGYTSATYSGPMGAGGFRIHDFVSSGTGAALQLEPSLEAPAAVVVVRLR